MVYRQERQVGSSLALGCLHLVGGGLGLGKGVQGRIQTVSCALRWRRPLKELRERREPDSGAMLVRFIVSRPPLTLTSSQEHSKAVG